MPTWRMIEPVSEPPYLLPPPEERHLGTLPVPAWPAPGWWTEAKQSLGLYDVREFGPVDPTGDNGPLINEAATAAAGGILLFPPGAYPYSTTLTPPSNTHFLGLGGTNPSSPVSQLIYTGSGARAIDLRSLVHVRLESLGLMYSTATASFTGTLIDFSKSGAVPSTLTVEQCYIGGTTSAAAGAAQLLDLHGAVNIAVDRNVFGYGVTGILGRSVVGDICNAVQLTRNVTIGNALTTAWLKNAGQSWWIAGNTIEPVGSGAPGAYIGAFAEEAFAFVGNWMGDLSQAGVFVQFNAAPLGVHVAGNRFGLSSIGTGVQFTANNPNGLSIVGNEFNGSAGATGIDFGSITGVRAYMIGGNIYSTNVTPIAGDGQLILRGLIDNGTGVFVGAGRSNAGSRPAAGAVGVGAVYYNTTTNIPNWSDGTNWRDAAGGIV